MSSSAVAADPWARWRPEIAKAVAGTHQTIESLEADLHARRLHLWAGERACILAEIVAYPGGARACQPTWTAGDSLADVLDELRKLEAFAKAAGCTEMLVEGPAGWARALRDAGYKPWSVTIRKEL